MSGIRPSPKKRGYLLPPGGKDLIHVLQAMREWIRQSKKNDGLLGIRIGVWLIVFGGALFCVLTISISSRGPTDSTPETASESLSHQESAAHHPDYSRRASRMEFTPATYEAGASHDLDETQLTMIDQMTQDRRTWLDNPRDP